MISTNCDIASTFGAACQILDRSIFFGGLSRSFVMAGLEAANEAVGSENDTDNNR